MTASSPPSDWLLDPAVTYLNHGAFGSCPRPVMAAAQNFRERFERAPMQFVLRELEPLLDEARSTVARFLKADPSGLVFVPNATTGVNAVLSSLRMQPGDEVVVTDHGYTACRNALNHYAARAGVQVIVAAVPFPLPDEQTITAAVLGAVTARTRLVMLDHVTSATALVFPVAALVRTLQERGVDTLIDGAHAPGMVPVELDALGATYYVANFHKWCCAPKTAAVLYIRDDRRGQVRPTVIGHGASSPRGDRTRLFLEFDWPGTTDPSPVLSVPFALQHLEGLMPGGLPALQARNHALAVQARRLLCDALAIPLPCPDQLLGSMAALPLPDGPNAATAEVLYEALWRRHQIEAPVYHWPVRPRRLLRISAQIYNDLTQYAKLAAALGTELAPEGTT